MQQIPYGALRHNAKAALDHALEVDSAPADDPVHRYIGTSFYDPVELYQVLRPQ